MGYLQRATEELKNLGKVTLENMTIRILLDNKTASGLQKEFDYFFSKGYGATVRLEKVSEKEINERYYYELKVEALNGLVNQDKRLAKMLVYKVLGHAVKDYLKKR